MLEGATEQSHARAVLSIGCYRVALNAKAQKREKTVLVFNVLRLSVFAFILRLPIFVPYAISSIGLLLPERQPLCSTPKHRGR